MSNTLINQMTLDYFKIKQQSKSRLSKASKKDIHFYRKRVIQLTKDLLSPDENLQELFPDIKYAFDIYVKNCVEYFKTLDKSDILQEDYKNIETEINIVAEDTPDIQDAPDDTTKQINKLIMKKTKDERCTLDKFIKRTIIKLDEPFIPVQKEINLNDPVLRIKGIRKKKNIDNNYDESDPKKEETHQPSTSEI
jgi:hypothetical protein